MGDDFLRVLTRAEVGFDLLFGMQQVPASIIADMRSKDHDKSAKAMDAVVERLTERFDRYQMRGPSPTPVHGGRSR